MILGISATQVDAAGGPEVDQRHLALQVGRALLAAVEQHERRTPAPRDAARVPDTRPRRRPGRPSQRRRRVSFLHGRPFMTAPQVYVRRPRALAALAAVAAAARRGPDAGRPHETDAAARPQGRARAGRDGGRRPARPHRWLPRQPQGAHPVAGLPRGRARRCCKNDRPEQAHRRTGDRDEPRRRSGGAGRRGPAGERRQGDERRRRQGHPGRRRHLGHRVLRRQDPRAARRDVPADRHRARPTRSSWPTSTTRSPARRPASAWSRRKTPTSSST